MDLSLDIKLRNLDLMARTRHIAELSAEERRRFALEAVRDRDKERLWEITQAYLVLHGRSGSKISPHTLRSYKRGLELLLEAWSGENLLRPSEDQGLLYVRMLEAEGLDQDSYAHATVRNRLAAARIFYRALRWLKATEATPFDGVQAARDLSNSWEQQAAYQETEFNLLLLNAKDEQDRLILYLGAHAGLRVSEMLKLEWRHIRFDRSELLVDGGKGGKSAWVSLSPSLELELLRQKPETTARRVLSLRSWFGIYERVRQMCLRASVDFLGVHALRHLAGSKLYEQTESLGIVADHLRHASMETARRYAKDRSKKVKKALESW